MNSPVEQRLRNLPELAPPAYAWSRIRRRARREHWRQLWPVVVAGGLATSAAVLVLTVALTTWQATPVDTTLLVAAPVQELHELQDQSRVYEDLLRSLPREQNLVRAEDAAAIAELEDRIARVDWMLSRSPRTVPAHKAAPGLWRERVGLMGELVRARYTQAGVAAY
jgi:DNA polymerase III psi subunit